MTFYEFLNQIYTSSPDWIKALLILTIGILGLGLTYGLPTILARFVLSWRALSLSRDEVRRLNRLSLDETNQPDQPPQKPEPRPPYLPPLDDDPHFPLAKPEDYAPFNEPYPDEDQDNNHNKEKEAHPPTLNLSEHNVDPVDAPDDPQAPVQAKQPEIQQQKHRP